MALSVLVLGTAAVAQQPQWMSANISTLSGSIGSGVITQAGQLFISVLDPSTYSQDVYLDGVNLSSSILGTQRSAIAVGLTGGTCAWYGSGSATGGSGRTHVYLNSNDYSLQVLGTVYQASAAGYTPGGLAWFGKKTVSGPQDVYRNATALSTSLGSSRFGVADGINDLGDVIWHGAGSNTGSSQDVYVNSNNYSSGLLTGSRSATGAAINNSGVVAWTGMGTNTGSVRHAFKNSTDYTALYAGSQYVGRAFQLDSSGRMAWIQYGPPGGLSDIWLDGQVLSSFLAANRQAVPFGMSSRGDVLWTGAGNALPHGVQDVFVNQFNLSAAVLGPGRGTSQAVTINSAGWVLWDVPVDSATCSAIVSMPRVKIVSGTLVPVSYIGNLAALNVTVGVVESHKHWNMGQLPVTLDASGRFSVALPEGMFDLTFTPLHYLSRKLAAVDTTSGTPIADPIVCLGGDATSDNAVNLADLGMVLSDMGSGNADLNGDGTTNLQDLTIVLANFGLVGD